MLSTYIDNRITFEPTVFANILIKSIMNGWKNHILQTVVYQIGHTI